MQLGTGLSVLAVVAALAVLALPVAGRLGAFEGRAPATLGVRDGRLAPPSATPNSVSSQAALWPGEAAAAAQVAPLPAPGGRDATMSRLRAVIEAMPGARVVQARDDYLHATFTSRWMRFVDDAEFWHDPVAQAVQLRSASRLGQRDFGVNRARIEAIRRAMSGPAGGTVGAQPPTPRE